MEIRNKKIEKSSTIKRKLNLFINIIIISKRIKNSVLTLLFVIFKYHIENCFHLYKCK